MYGECWFTGNFYFKHVGCQNATLRYNRRTQPAQLERAEGGLRPAKLLGLLRQPPAGCRIFIRLDRSILVAFSSEEIERGECTKSSMSHKVDQQDQCVSVRRPYICVSQSGVTDDCEWTSTQPRSGVD